MDTFYVFDAEKSDTKKLEEGQKAVIKTGMKRVITQSIASSLVALIGEEDLFLFYGLAFHKSLMENIRDTHRFQYFYRIHF